MKVTVRFESSLRSIAGTAAMDVDLPEGAAVQGLLDTLVEIFGDRIVGGDREYNWRHSADYVAVLRNGEALARSAYSVARLVEGDVVSLVPPIAGGQVESAGGRKKTRRNRVNATVRRRHRR